MPANYRLSLMMDGANNGLVATFVGYWLDGVITTITIGNGHFDNRVRPSI